MSDLKPELKNLPIGVSDWEAIRKADYFFVDKTAQLRNLVSKPKIFLSRPRRMGKSMLCSMLKNLFTNGVRDFEGTAVHDLWTEDQGSDAVINLSFYRVKGDNLASFENSLISKIVTAYKLAGYPEVEAFAQDANNLDNFLDKLNQISRKDYLVFLIDEWDHPLSSNLGDEEKYNIALTVLQTFYSWLRELDHLRFVLVTGIMRYKSTSLFTGQDIRDISMDPDYASLVGYTHEELITNYAPYIKEAARRLGISEDELIAQLEAYYDGFCFDEEAKVKLYSPWDINLFFDAVAPNSSPTKMPKFQPYWMDSSNAAEALKYYLQSRPTDFKELCELKYKNTELTAKAITSPVDFAQISVLPLLAESGYLTIKGIKQGGSNPTFYCGLPNREVLDEFDWVLMDHINTRISKSNKKLLSTVKQGLGKALLQGDIKSVCYLLNEIFSGILYDTFKFPHEALYRTLIAGWFRDVATEVREETPNYKGRSDIELTIGDKFYVFELKLIHNITPNDNKRSFKDKYGLLKAASQQIISKGYAVNPHTEGKPVIGVALVISNMRRCIAAWHQFDANGGSCGLVSTVNLFTKYLEEQNRQQNQDNDNLGQS